MIAGKTGHTGSHLPLDNVHPPSLENRFLMTPREAFYSDDELVSLDTAAGRVSSEIVTVYPPGIPLLIPGEVFNQKIVEYLKFNREFARECPGFETDIHGLVQERGEDGVMHYFADCVAQ